MKVLHVASFAGNIGDNANHKGMRKCLGRALQCELTYTELEIRYCYRIYKGEHRWAFDDDFVALANAHDLIIVGGGNFFEPWLDESSTATTIDITNERLERITKPLVFFGLGFDIHKGCSPQNQAKYLQFFQACLAKKNVLISFRNDGSLKNFKMIYPDRLDLYSKINVVPDGGFSFEVDFLSAPYLSEGVYWGVNVASDMEALRFPAETEGCLTWQEFLKAFANVLEGYLLQRSDLKIILFPHIYKDISAIGELLAYLDDRLCRDRVVVAPFASGVPACNYVFSLYKRCELVMGMRFHTNVCAIAMNIPAIPLVSYPKLHDLYEELGLLERAVYANRDDFPSELIRVVDGMVADLGFVKLQNDRLIEGLEASSFSFFDKIKKILV